MHAPLTQHVTEQLAGAVDDPRLTGERGVARHEPDDLDHPHRVEVTHLGPDGGQGIQRAGPGELGGALGGDESLA